MVTRTLVFKYNTTTGEILAMAANAGWTLGPDEANLSYTGPTIKLMQDLIENPEPLLNPPDITEEQLDKLMLKKYKEDRIAREKERKKQRKKEKKIR